MGLCFSSDRVEVNALNWNLNVHIFFQSKEIIYLSQAILHFEGFWHMSRNLKFPPGSRFLLSFMIESDILIRNQGGK